MMKKIINYAGLASISVFVGLLISALTLKYSLYSIPMIEMDWTQYMIWTKNISVYHDVMITSLIGIIVTAIVMVYANMSSIVREQKRSH